MVILLKAPYYFNGLSTEHGCALICIGVRPLQRKTSREVANRERQFWGKWVGGWGLTRWASYNSFIRTPPQNKITRHERHPEKLQSLGPPEFQQKRPTELRSPWGVARVLENNLRAVVAQLNARGAMSGMEGR